MHKRDKTEITAVYPVVWGDWDYEQTNFHRNNDVPNPNALDGHLH